MNVDPRRRIPSVDSLLLTPSLNSLVASYGRERVAGALRGVMDSVRAGLREPGFAGAPVDEAGWWAEEVAARLRADDVPSLRPVINATGVVLHTNLGRAPLAVVAREAMAQAALGYDNLEMDLETGRRGSRYDHCAGLLAELSGAPAALVVNNAAGALLLALNTVARGRGVVVSRGELVEIGGGFRIPEILERSGARLVEVGSTNRTRASDYANALASEDAAAVLKVHRSNFRMAGFTAEASLAELSVVCRGAGIPLLHDLGSGLFADPADLGLPAEPRARESLALGADVVVVSGDKLLGGPQAGLVMGQTAVVSAMRTNPLCRALRVDKVTLAGLEATLRLYRHRARSLEEIPTLHMLRQAPEVLRARAEALAARLAAEGIEGCAVEPVSGAVGGGTYPEVSLPSWAVALRTEGVEGLAGRLRWGDPAVVARIEDQRVLLDVRTVAGEEEDALVRCVRAAWQGRDA